MRDMGTPLDDILRLRQETSEGKIVGPRMLVAGPLLEALSPSGCPSSSRSAMALKRRRPSALSSSRAWTSRGSTTCSRGKPTVRVAAECRRQHLQFAGHLPICVSASEASDAGQRSIEHLGSRYYGVLRACSTQEPELDVAVRAILDAAMKGDQSADGRLFQASLTRPLLDSFSDRKASVLFARFVKNHTWQVPTLVALKEIWAARLEGSRA